MAYLLTESPYLGKIIHSLKGNLMRELKYAVGFSAKKEKKF